ncbi:hypothetical protein IGI04_025970 [Brassica rapa subsp. trilocularis]|uniref:Uncharacterized protein n=1 Tax=Brassica rapa subsp. trilocularis TaxID=1813537 RepID=A0ABQ7KUL7_BRACM|nr:hypothetical protein IGI04_025970 [Brassica rapa subsp. trilocularis]
MPATAGRVRMPANNRVHSSAALQTHGIWQSAIGYDPYAPTAKEEPKTTQQKSDDPENSYASFQGLLALARITGSNNDEARGSWRRLGGAWGEVRLRRRRVVRRRRRVRVRILMLILRLRRLLLRGMGRRRRGVAVVVVLRRRRRRRGVEIGRGGGGRRSGGRIREGV